MKTKSNWKLIVSLINYQVLIAINIILYLAKEQGESFYLKERYTNAISNDMIWLVTQKGIKQVLYNEDLIFLFDDTVRNRLLFINQNGGGPTTTAPSLAASTWWCSPRPSLEGWAEIARHLPQGVQPSGRPNCLS